MSSAQTPSRQTGSGRAALDPAPGLWRVAESDPGRLAYVQAPSAPVTFGELAARVNAASHGLRAAGVGRDDALAVCLPNCVEAVELRLATQQSGLHFVPVDWHLSPADVAYIVDNSDAVLLVAGADVAARAGGALDAVGFPADRRFVVGGPLQGWRPYAELVEGQSTSLPRDRTAGQYMAYTSGTTGRPKGVRKALTGATPEDNAASVARFAQILGFRAGPGEVHLVTSPLYHSAPGSMANAAVHLGQTLVVMERFDAERMLRLVDEHRVTSTQAVPTMFVRMLRLPAEVREGYDLSSLNAVIHAGAPCPVHVKRDLIAWLGPVVNEYYASSEGMATIILAEDWLAHPGSVGRPLPGTTVRILREDGSPAPAGEVGGVYFGYPSLQVAYHKDPEKTAASWRDGLFTAGDLGYLDDEGYLFLADRRTDLIISGGANVYPAEVEQYLLTHPSIDDVGVIGVPDAEWGQSVLAIVKTHPGVPGTPDLAEQLDAYCRQGLAPAMRPRRYEFRGTLPRTEAGKILRRVLRDPYWSDTHAR